MPNSKVSLLEKSAIFEIKSFLISALLNLENVVFFKRFVPLG